MFEKKSKLMAVAIGAAFALPIMAQAQTNVTVYGKMYPDISHISTGGALANGDPGTSTIGPAANGTPSYNRTMMDSPNSRIGFKGTEDLGGGLKAIFQAEMGFSLDTGANSTPDTPFSRNTFVGLKGGFGTIRLGNMDTVYKELGDKMNFLGITSGNFMALSNVLSKPSFTTNGASSFHLRRANSFYYTSPKLGGFTGLFDWSPNETAGDNKAGVYSMGVKYDGGPIYAALAYELHKDMFGGSNGMFANGGTQKTFANVSAASTVTATNAIAGATSSDQAIRATFQYKFTKDFSAEINLAHLQYSESGQVGPGKFDKYKHQSYSISVEKDIGAIQLVASAGGETAGSCTLTGGTACNTNGLNARMFNAGIGYSLSKRTSLFGVYSYIGNTTGVASNTLDGSAKPGAGQDISTIALGISHSF
jgi:predicted porin